MTHIWTALDDNQRAALTCMLTMTVGLFIGAAVTWWHIRTAQTVTDDPIDEYRTHADDVYDQEQEPDNRAVAALRAELDAWGSA